MMLPEPVRKDGIRKAEQVKFGGLNRGLGASDGELRDMRNMTGDHAPLLASRGPRGRLLLDGYAGAGAGSGGATAVFAHEELCLVIGGGFYYGGNLKGSVSPGAKEFAALGDTVVILPDKAYYNAHTDEFGNLESRWGGSALTFSNGKLWGEAADCNALHAPGAGWAAYFRPGDAVTVSGCTERPSNNKTPVVREIDGDWLYFSEYAFRLAGDGGAEPYTESGEMSVERVLPDLRHICEHGNRLWGCDGRAIYASKPGDPFNFNVFEGLDTDAWAVDVGSPGVFTACAQMLGHPVFFKENAIYKVYGSLPSNYEVVSSATLGVMEGCAGSVAVAAETAHYLSRAGVVAYSGGIPRPVSEAFGAAKFASGAAGSDGLKYYACLWEAGPGGGVSGAGLLYVYDARLGTWHIEDDIGAKQFAFWRGGLYALCESGEVWRVSGAPGGIPEEPEGGAAWYAEFADWSDGSPDRKGITKVQLRLELDEGADAKVHYMADSDGVWREVLWSFKPARKRSYYLPVIPRRADHYRIRVSGTGGCRVHSVSRERYQGSGLTNHAAPERKGGK